MKKNISKILAIIVISVLLLNTNIILAANAPGTAALENEKKENDAKKQEAEKELQEVQNKKSEAVKQVESISSQIDSYENQIEELDNKLSELNTKISDSEKKIKEKQEDYSKSEEAFKQKLVASYEAGDTSYLDVLLSSESVTDLISNYYMVSELADYDSELLEKIQKEKEEIENAKKTLESSKTEVATTKSSKQQVTSQLQATKTEKSKYVSQLSEDEKTIQNKIEKIREDNKQIDKDITAKNQAYKAQIEALRKQQEQQSRQQSQTSSGGSSGSSASSGTSTSTSGKTSSSGFIRPVNSYITTGMYYSSGSYHGAVDFGASGINGSPVFAVADGVVMSTHSLTTSYGNYIIIYHPSSNVYTLYAHGQAGSICVSPGQTVKQGQQIMRVGSTGNSSGPHLHFEVRRSPGTYSNRVNPTAYLP